MHIRVVVIVASRTSGEFHMKMSQDADVILHSPAEPQSQIETAQLSSEINAREVNQSRY